MNAIKTYQRTLKKAKRLAQNGDFQNAWQTANALLADWPDNPQLLVLWADLLQLQDDDGGPPLDDAKKAYVKATELNSESPSPFIELAQYQFAVEDDVEGAAKNYDRAIVLCKQLLRDALLGKAKAMYESGDAEKALDYFAQAYWLQNSGDARGKNGNGKAMLEQWKLLQS